MPQPPRPPIKPWLSPDFYFAVLDVQQILQPTGYYFVVTTDVPCRLCMRWTTNPPQYHNYPRFLRGVYMHSDRYICFTAYNDNWQQEPGEGTTHTFIKLGWPSCQTRWFYFWGTKGVHVMASTSCIFEKHFTAPPPPPVTEYLPCWHNRRMYSRHGTWSTARNGFNVRKDGDYQRPLSQLDATTSLIATYLINRSYLNFNTKVGMPADPVVSARVGIWITSLTGITGDLVLTKGLWREPVVDTDWALQTNEVANLGQLAQGALVLNQYNWIPLNAAGIAWLNSSMPENKQHESYDWQKNAYLDLYHPRWFSQSFTPQTSHKITRMKVRIKKVGSPGHCRCELYLAGVDHCPTGAYLARDSIHPDFFSTDTWGDWLEYHWDPGVDVIAGVEYCVVLYILGGNSTNKVQWIGCTANQYPNGTFCYSLNAGVSWTDYPNHHTYFIEYEEQLEGQTNFCLRTSYDVGDAPPGAGVTQSAVFHSAQKGVGFYPILEVTT